MKVLKKWVLTTVKLLNINMAAKLIEEIQSKEFAIIILLMYFDCFLEINCVDLENLVEFLFSQ